MEVGDSPGFPFSGQCAQLRMKSLAPLRFSGKGGRLICTMSPRYRSRVSNGEGNAGGRDYSQATAEQMEQNVQKLMDDAYQLARTTLMANRDKLEVIAKGL